jgi:hypothetical protein
MRESDMHLLLLQGGADDLEEAASRLRALRPAHRTIRAQKPFSQVAYT